MSAQVDVLAVLDAAAEWRGDFMGDFTSAAELKAARAAVAALIADRDALLTALKCALPHVEHAYHTHEDLDGSFWIDVVGCRSAIARAQGVQS